MWTRTSKPSTPPRSFWPLGVALCGASLPAFAANDALAPPSLGDDVLGVLSSLVVVVAAIIAVLWFYARSRGGRATMNQVIDIVAAQPLGPKERIVLLEVGGTQIVVGMTATQVQTLHVFDEPVVQRDRTSGVPSPFAGRLRQFLKGHAR